MRLKCLYIFGFVAVIAVPIVMLIVGLRPSTIENRALTPLPSLAPAAVLELETYGELEGYVLDRMPGRDLAVELDATIDYRLLGQSPSADVVVGGEGWLFLADSVDQDCISEDEARDFVAEIERAHGIVNQTGRDLVFALAPDKVSIYPDRLGSEADRAACSASTRERIRVALGAAPNIAVTAWKELEAAADDELVYHRHDTHWNAIGASAYAALLVDRLQPDLPLDSSVTQTGTAAYEGDLTRMLGIPWSDPAPIVETTRDGLAEADTTSIALAHDFTATRWVRGASEAPTIGSPTLLLHDSFGVGLLKHVTPFFNDLTAVRETHIDYEYVRPLLADAETVVVEKAERYMASYVLDERLSSKMVSAFLEELDPSDAVVSTTPSSIIVEPPPPTAANESAYLVAVIDRTVGSVSMTWNSATGPDETRKLGGFRNRVAWRVPSGGDQLELFGFPPDVEVDAFYVVVEAPAGSGS